MLSGQPSPSSLGRLSGRKIIMNIELQYLNHEFDVEWRTAPHLTNPLDDCLLSLSLLLGELSQANLQVRN